MTKEDTEVKRFLDDLYKVLVDGEFPDYRVEDVNVTSDEVMARIEVKRKR